MFYSGGTETTEINALYTPKGMKSYNIVMKAPSPLYHPTYQNVIMKTISASCAFVSCFKINNEEGLWSI